VQRFGEIDGGADGHDMIMAQMRFQLCLPFHSS
jgi:hypothetical protein